MNRVRELLNKASKRSAISSGGPEATSVEGETLNLPKNMQVQERLAFPCLPTTSQGSRVVKIDHSTEEKGVSK